MVLEGTAGMLINRVFPLLDALGERKHPLPHPGLRQLHGMAFWEGLDFERERARAPCR